MNNDVLGMQSLDNEEVTPRWVSAVSVHCTWVSAWSLNC